jgi:hypothetical protein
MAGLHTGAVVIIAAFDEVPQHRFVIHTVEDDCVTGIALTGPLAGAYGEPGFDLILGFYKDGLGS